MNDSIRPKFDFGPVHTLFGGNKIEGFRMRVGGMTLAALNPHFFAQGYIAYGFKDKRWKWRGALTYLYS